MAAWKWHIVQLLWQRSLEALMPSNWQQGGHLGQQIDSSAAAVLQPCQAHAGIEIGPAVSAEPKHAKHAQRQEAEWLPGGAGDAQSDGLGCRARTCESPAPEGGVAARRGVRRTGYAPFPGACERDERHIPRRGAGRRGDAAARPAALGQRLSMRWIGCPLLRSPELGHSTVMPAADVM